jgi:hypothetical protein
MVLPGCLEYVIRHVNTCMILTAMQLLQGGLGVTGFVSLHTRRRLYSSSKANMSKDGVAHMIEGNSFLIQCGDLSLRAKKSPVLRLSAPRS